MNGTFFHIEICLGSSVVSAYDPFYFDPQMENARVPGSNWQLIHGIVRCPNLNTAEQLVIDSDAVWRPVRSRRVVQTEIRDGKIVRAHEVFRYGNGKVAVAA